MGSRSEFLRRIHRLIDPEKSHHVGRYYVYRGRTLTSYVRDLLKQNPDISTKEAVKTLKHLFPRVSSRKIRNIIYKERSLMKSRKRKKILEKNEKAKFVRLLLALWVLSGHSLEEFIDKVPEIQKKL